MQGERPSGEVKQRAGATRAMLCACWLMAAWVLATLVGCTPWKEYVSNGFKVGPNYCPPPAAVADDWIDSADQRIRTEEPDLSHWWTVFDDPELNELIAAAYQQNLTLREAGYRILQARAALAIQIGEFFPQTQQATGIGTRNAVSLLAANQQFLPQQFFSNYNLGLNMAWELDFWGRFRRAIAAADADLDASIFNYDDVLVILLGDVAATYVEMRTVQQQLAYVRQNIVIQKESLDIALARYKGGLTSDLDVEQATSQLAQTEALVPQLEIQLRQANNRACVLLGIPTRDLTPLMGNAPIPTAPPDAIVGIPAQLLMRRPDIRRAEREAAAQCEQIGIAESNLYPSISITGTIAYDAEQFNQLFRSQSQEGAIGPSFRWNVLNYGRLINAVRLQEARYMELATRYRNVVLEANADVENGLVEFLQSQVEARSMKKSVDAAEKAVQLAIVQYRGGLTDFNRVALLEQNLVQQQDLYAQSVGNIAIGLIRTYRALGGGWEIRCQSGQIVEGSPTEAVVTPDAATPPEELPLGKPKQPTVPKSVAPALPRQLPHLDRTPEEPLPKDSSGKSNLNSQPGEIIAPKDRPPRTAPDSLPDLGPENMPDEDVFGPGKSKSQSGEPKPPLFEQPNPPPADSIFGPAEIPSIQNPGTPKSQSNPNSADRPRSEPPPPPAPPMSNRRRPVPVQVRQATVQGTPNVKPLFRPRVQHAGLLPEDRGEVRRVR